MANVLVVSAHPDDAELSAGGTIRKLVLENHKVVLLDCTAGENGTRGNATLRKQEADNAASILGVAHREILSMPDGHVSYCQEHVLTLVKKFREYKPDIIITSPPVERHPDHEAVHKLAVGASFLCGLPKVLPDTYSSDYTRPQKVFCYQQNYDLPEQNIVYVDVSNTWEGRENAILAYASQFNVPDRYVSDEPQTILSRPEFMSEQQARCMHYGTRIGVQYAEAFLVIGGIGVKSLSTLF
ncbi:MAG: bacillithiol biosynthesis deacetylase BshB1 [Chlorobi bacterium]|jgi:Uncharacterized proteins, LmbE homologs|nr:MAG: bacillithiol biosynthesis deacetylase BshB1 [Bacteroidota bacterium]KXK34614.1 MAG: lmbe family protein [Chlorobi bacterium OLB6]MBE2265922.1 bacillithiol biosynthesis deacetylase BshB1 [Flavobacteriales bacterium]MBL1160917.1 bacillithiol biosynthesis deacetylase BshB1 [Chlorobiota bacterium]MBW7852878.1 bacillithiol biosynthesis deacetylase BshB1 [Candidatus Kapabacteria bacterium]MCC6330891.1 bacillithiol biosynthesis deacetylase BshB1 [Ignavibacteria bacterium]